MNVEFRKCKTCKEKFRGYKQNGIWVSRLCLKCRKEREAEKKEKKKTTKKYQKSERKKLHKKAWTLISLKIRKDALGWRDYYYCYTCEKAFPSISDLQCGHRYHGRLDFDERNLKGQCVQCNHHLSGNLGSYERRLIEDKGLEWSKKLELDANTHLGYTIQELKQIIQLYE